MTAREMIRRFPRDASGDPLTETRLRQVRADGDTVLACTEKGLAVKIYYSKAHGWTTYSY